jgi:comEA protein
MRIVRSLQHLLGFTRNELLVLLFLSTALITGALLRLVFPASAGARIPQFDYAQSDSVFTELTRTHRDPSVGQAAPVSGGDRKSAKTLPAKGSININTATAEDLGRLPGVGPATAQRIIEFRVRHGRFTSVEELTKVKGIGPKKLEKLRPYVTVR